MKPIRLIITGFYFLLFALVLGAFACSRSKETSVTPVSTSNNTTTTLPIPDTSKFPTLQALIPSVPSSYGLVWTNGALWSHNDSGNPEYIYKLDTSNGNALQIVHITNYSNVDWEDIDADSSYIYIGDFGNNNGNRTDLRILKVLKSSIDSGYRVDVKATAIIFSYPDQTSFSIDANSNYDCEALISFGDSLYIFTKDHSDYQTRLYSLPKTPGTYSAHLISQFNSSGKITGATVNPQKNTIFLSGYEGGHSNPFVWRLEGFTGNNFFSGSQKRVLLSPVSGIKWQVEGITFTPSSRIWISNEAISPGGSEIISSSELWKTTLYRLFGYD